MNVKTSVSSPHAHSSSAITTEPSERYSFEFQETRVANTTVAKAQLIWTLFIAALMLMVMLHQLSEQETHFFSSTPVEYLE